MTWYENVVKRHVSTNNDVMTYRYLGMGLTIEFVLLSAVECRGDRTMKDGVDCRKLFPSAATF